MEYVLANNGIKYFLG